MIDWALYLLGGLIVGYCLYAVVHFWTHRRCVSWDYDEQRWRSSSRVFEDRRWR